MSGPSAPKKRQGTRLKRTHQADRESQRRFTEARQINLSREHVEELRNIGHSCMFSQDVAELASTYAMSKALGLGNATVKQDRAFLKRVRTKTKHLLRVLDEGPAEPLVLYGAMAHIPKELERLLEEIKCEESVLTATAKRAPDRANLQVVCLLRELFNKHNLNIANSRDGAFCQCLGLILDAAGYPVDDPYHLIESFQKFPDHVPTIPATFE